MALREYRKKRDFKRTPEPAGGRIAKSKGRLRYVIQKHAATRLHYDFRLEMEGALKSWAVPKGPSLDPAEKRLAVEVEDHPMEYGKFEGTIPKGEYGGGSVLLWDRGTWRPDGDPLVAYRAGKLKFELDGEKLRGGWTLVRMRSRDGEDRSKPNWLLIKERDDEARSARQGEVVEARPESVASGRAIEEIGVKSKVWHSNRAAKKRAAPDPSRVEGAKKAPLPRTIAPQLATLVDRAPAGDDWIFEIKLDGYRTIARLEKGKARLQSRDGTDWTARFPEIVAALEALPVRSALLDGELVVLLPDGTTSFQELQNVMRRTSREDVALFAFDLMYLDGWDLTRAAIEDRKQVLEALLDGAGSPLHYSEHVRGNGEAFHRAACGHGLEGVIAKHAGQPYRSGRSAEWRKIKCLGRQEFVIGGYTDPAGSRKGFGALLLGVNDDGGLRFAGKVGTGFGDALLRELARKLEALETKTSPFVDTEGRTPRGVHWVRPRLVAEVEFTGWTRDGRLRHPAFLGLRMDKKAADVVRERAVAAPKAKAKAKAHGDMRLTHPDKVLYPDVGLTKRDLAAYVRLAAPRMLPLVAGRPLMLLRCPDGAAKPCFHQKNAPETIPAGLVPVEIPDAKGDAEGTYLAVKDAEGLVSLVQMGALEIHLWGSRANDLERPERLVFDLDPGPGVPWRDVIRGAMTVRDLLAELGLKSFPLVTGGKGVHVIVPLRPSAEWPDVKAFCHAVVQAMVKREPKRYTAQMAKLRREKKIFVDYLRNGRGATAIAPYSMRARGGATIAVPVTWRELEAGVKADAFRVQDAKKRLAGRDPWTGYETSRASLAPVLRAARGATMMR